MTPTQSPGPSIDQLDRSRTTLAHLIADALADGRTPRPADVDAYRTVTADYDQALGLAPLTHPDGEAAS